MSAEDGLCAKCAKERITCCQQREIYITLGDVERISAYTDQVEFIEFRVPTDPAYLDQDDDPVWKEYVFRADNSRRVLKRDEKGNCTFLKKNGCELPEDIRPLVCRLYPFSYTSDGILLDLEHDCPVHLLQQGQTLIDALNMSFDKAQIWHQMLYQEILLEK